MKYKTAIVIETSRPTFSVFVKYRSNDIAEHQAKVLSYYTYFRMENDPDDIFGCIRTLDQDFTNLLEIELELKERLAIDCHDSDIRAKLIELDKKNELIEDEYVMKWHDAFASYKAELEYQLAQLNKLIDKKIDK